MTKKEIITYENEIKDSIKIIEEKLNITYHVFDNRSKLYVFKITNNLEMLNLSKNSLIALSKKLSL